MADLNTDLEEQSRGPQRKKSRTLSPEINGNALKSLEINREISRINREIIKLDRNPKHIVDTAPDPATHF